MTYEIIAPIFLRKTAKTIRKLKENQKENQSAFAKTFSWFSRFRKKENENAKLKKTRKRENDENQKLKKIRKRENHENPENGFVPTPALFPITKL